MPKFTTFYRCPRCGRGHPVGEQGCIRRPRHPRCPECGKFVRQWPTGAQVAGEGGDYPCERGVERLIGAAEARVA